MWGGWRGIRGRDNLRGTNRQTSSRSCARAWALSSTWPLSSCCHRSSCLLIRDLRVPRSYTANRLHCNQHINNVLVVLCAHQVTAQQTEVSFNMHMEKPSILVMQYEINNQFMYVRINNQCFMGPLLVGQFKLFHKKLGGRMYTITLKAEIRNMTFDFEIRF